MYDTASPFWSRTSRRGIAGTTKNDMGTITANDHSKPLRQLMSTALKAELARYADRGSFRCAFDGEYGFVIAVLYPAIAKQVG
ncbi:hypothetical protein K227x_01260 [Rubripirellula lacrimiformis]|uniref:Uncharacterized protein n=1 Tax=Rubripirellula lacrimiformis TaxID=1930273 RepID=A0A517N430_9BACT|nr:hypothetical protein K227x_01260 [Rubripirellula lacrimiformis]